MSKTQNIVIIGGSVAGGNLVNELVPNLPETYRILLIDALGYSTWSPASTRGAVVPGWEKRVSVPLTTETVFPADSFHEVIAPNRVIELRESSVVLEHPFEGSTEVPFWVDADRQKAIIATGAQQPSPMRPVPGSTEQEYLGALTKLQAEFAQAKKILVVGAGAVGLELAGDLRERFPETTITLVHSNSSVLNPTAKQPDLNSGHFNYSSPPTAAKLSKTLEGQLKALKIELVLNDKVVIPAEPSADVSAWDGSFGLQSGLKKVKLQSGEELDADFVFVSIGNKPNVSLVEYVDKGAITQGLIAVDEYLKVVSQSQSSILTANYYAIGDCASSPGWKTAQGAQLEAVGAGANILAEVKGKPIKPFSKPKPYAMFIPLGTTSGSGTLDFPFIGTVSVPTFGVKAGKGKKLLVEDLFIPRFKGSKKPPVPALPA